MIRTIFLPILVVCLLSLGQIGFKIIGNRFNSFVDVFKVENFFVLGSVLSIYAIATMAWIYVLSYMDLSRAFVFYALTFVFVPILSLVIFKEKIEIWQVLGSILVIAGVLITTRH